MWICTFDFDQFEFTSKCKNSSSKMLNYPETVEQLSQEWIETIATKYKKRVGWQNDVWKLWYLTNTIFLKSLGFISFSKINRNNRNISPYYQSNDRNCYHWSCTWIYLLFRVFECLIVLHIDVLPAASQIKSNGTNSLAK